VIGVVECGQGISHGDGCGSNGKSPLHVQQLEEALEIWDTKVGGKDGWVCKHNVVKTFIVKEVYASLNTYRFEDICSFFNQI